MLAGRRPSGDPARSGSVIYLFLADLLVVVHGIFILFVALGGLLVLRWPKLALVHLPSAAWGALVEIAGWVCPLTPLEWRLRRLGGAAGYGGGFIEHYVIPVIYPPGLTHGVQVALGVSVIAVNGVIYAAVLRRRGRAAVPGADGRAARGARDGR